MTLTAGQQQALEQLNRLDGAGEGALRILDVEYPTNNNSYLRVDCAIDCSVYPHSNGGLKFKKTERFVIVVGRKFPFKHPEVWVRHWRFAGFPHVQWGRYFCLYQAPDTEWNSSDGIFGFMNRLHLWLERAAKNELDPIGGPIHPPAVYEDRGSAETIVAHANAPNVPAPWWIGYADLSTPAENRYDVVSWTEFGHGSPTGHQAVAVLLADEMPFEYPSKLGDLLRQLQGRGFNRELILALLKLAAIRAEKKPLFMLLGSPMRGTVGGQRLQHLVAWKVPDEICENLRVLDLSTDVLAEADKYKEDFVAFARECYEKSKEALDGWVSDAAVLWCRIFENRPEIVSRRDAATPMSAFASKTVAVWGCGALGSACAELLVRAGVKKVILYDSSRVGPGLLVRQNFVDADIGKPKAVALADRLRAIRQTGLDIEAKVEDLVDTISTSASWLQEADVILDASASSVVHSCLERALRNEKEKIPICSILIDAKAQRAVACVVGRQCLGGVLEALRRTKLYLSGRYDLSDFYDAFWPVDGARATFQPEPGCSAPTFVASGADVLELAASMLNFLAANVAVARDRIDVALLRRTHEHRTARTFIPLRFSSGSSFWFEQQDLQVRVDDFAFRDIRAWINANARTRGKDVETGGLLFGEMNRSLGILWLSEISGPPADSRHDSDGFVCGIENTVDSNRSRKERTRGSVSYVGSWHTHPVSAPMPSGVDYRGIGEMFTMDGRAVVQNELMLIVGWSASSFATVGAFLFSRDNAGSDREHLLLSMDHAHVRLPVPPMRPKRIGLALSGGGSRAMAFHLGCLRALNDLQVLDSVDVVSSVSGGSVIGAMYAYSVGTFEEFDERMQAVITKGFMRTLARRLFLSSRSPKIFLSFLVNAVVSLGAASANLLLRTFGVPRRVAATIRRRFSRTTAFADVLASQDLLGNGLLSCPRRGDLNVVINASELTTGTAFRFGSRESGCWRIGKVRNNAVSIAEAVTASAAYPIALPAIDRDMEFEGQDGEARVRRVLLSDGGIYENLGLTCLEPRADGPGFNRYSPELIISCDAGAGQLDDDDSGVFWFGRVSRAFLSVFRKAQDPIKARLHGHAESGTLRAFAYISLGQQDSKLPPVIGRFVDRASVVRYPTDFSSMSKADFERLTTRGEALTRALVAQYLWTEIS